MSLEIKRVLISDAVDESAVKLLEENNIKVDCQYKLTPEQLIAEIPKYDALIVRSDTKVTAAVLEASKLKVVGRAGTGVDNIDLPAASKRGTIVINAPSGNFVSACELTCSLISCLARNVAQACESLKKGKWDRKIYAGTELSGKTLAVLGLGKIGKEVAFRMQAFGMTVIGFDPVVSKEDAAKLNIESLELNQIWPRADYITVHTPLIPQTRNLINAEVLQKCKKGVKIINVARGGIVHEESLLASLKQGHCGGAAIDVFCEEPPKAPETIELIQHPKVVVTPHLGASTAEAQIRVAVEIAEQFIALTNLNPKYTEVRGIVNAPALEATRNPENKPILSLGEFLGKISNQLLKTSNYSATSVKITTKGAAPVNKNLITTAVKVGFVSSVYNNKAVNVINVNTLASELGVDVAYEHSTASAPNNTVTVTVSTGGQNHSITGAVINNVPQLIQIDDSVFSGPGLALSSNLIFYKVETNQSLASVIDSLTGQNISFTNLSIAKGRNSWLAFTLTNQLKTNSSENIISLA